MPLPQIYGLRREENEIPQTELFRMLRPVLIAVRMMDGVVPVQHLA